MYTLTLALGEAIAVLNLATFAYVGPFALVNFFAGLILGLFLLALAATR